MDAQQAIQQVPAQGWINPGEARVNITYAGQNGDLPDPVSYDLADGDVKAMVAEALRTGGVPGIPAQADPDLNDFVVDRFVANETRPWAMLQIRPKTPFGVKCQACGLGRTHDDPADCMRDLVNYVEPRIRETPEFRRALEAGVSAMKAELMKSPVPGYGA
jgi:hypothetical protein